MAFCQVNKKLKEHYGIMVPENGIRTNTLHHARLIKKWQDSRLGTINAPAKECVISETDGSMIPIVKTKQCSSQIKRITRQSLIPINWNQITSIKSSLQSKTTIKS